MNLLTLLVYFNILTELRLGSSSKRSQNDLEEGKVKFTLWNKNTKGQEIRVNEYGNITRKLPTKVLIHGWKDAGNGTSFFFYGPMVQKYINNGFNVICVDWSYYASRMYIDAMLWIRPVGDLVSKMIMGLKEKPFLIPYDKIHVIGLSMGAHMSGFIGKYIQQSSNGQKIDRITGIDPAGPWFRNKPNTDRLYKTDATKVDTVICDIFEFGMKEPLGQVNFYVACGGRLSTILLNHFFCPFYYQYGITKNDLLGKECECQLQQMKSCNDKITNTLGDQADFKKPGNFYLDIDVLKAMDDADDAMKTAPDSQFVPDFNLMKDYITIKYGKKGNKTKT